MFDGSRIQRIHIRKQAGANESKHGSRWVFSKVADRVVNSGTDITVSPLLGPSPQGQGTWEVTRYSGSWDVSHHVMRQSLDVITSEGADVMLHMAPCPLTLISRMASNNCTRAQILVLLPADAQEVSGLEDRITHLLMFLEALVKDFPDETPALAWLVEIHEIAAVEHMEMEVTEVVSVDLVADTPDSMLLQHLVEGNVGLICVKYAGDLRAGLNLVKEIEQEATLCHTELDEKKRGKQERLAALYVEMQVKLVMDADAIWMMQEGTSKSSGLDDRDIVIVDIDKEVAAVVTLLTMVSPRFKGKVKAGTAKGSMLPFPNILGGYNFWAEAALNRQSVKIRVGYAYGWVGVPPLHSDRKKHWPGCRAMCSNSCQGCSLVSKTVVKCKRKEDGDEVEVEVEVEDEPMGHGVKQQAVKWICSTVQGEDADALHLCKVVVAGLSACRLGLIAHKLQGIKEQMIVGWKVMEIQTITILQVHKAIQWGAQVTSAWSGVALPAKHSWHKDHGKSPTKPETHNEASNHEEENEDASGEEEYAIDLKENE
ncbi:hypothetical protein BKA62DRAFT_672193 [Auriculariales sp. MPI-PUGE-AT-0066]|nr:hypothetical protein BKA62DRAFT_672193 [Auriculariales sp. MPI-PUGE-AT-0066]